MGEERPFLLGLTGSIGELRSIISIISLCNTDRLALTSTDMCSAGMGKSTVSNMFRAQGVPVFDADEVS